MPILELLVFIIVGYAAVMGTLLAVDGARVLWDWWKNLDA